jgi:hypothetical protein
MATRTDRDRNGRRWQAETVMSMIGRRQGESVWSSEPRGCCRDTALMMPSHNMMIH